MTIGECFQLGYVTKVHGLNGEVTALFDVDTPQNYQELESVFVAYDEKLVPFFIDSFDLKGNKAIIGFEDIQSAEEAEQFKGKKLFLPLTILPELEDHQYYYHELIGYTVVDTDKTELGVVDQIYNLPGNDLIGVMHEGREILIPLKDELIVKLNKANKILNMRMPEGLLDIYKEEDEN